MATKCQLGIVVSYEVGRKSFPRRTHVSRDLGGERVQPSRDLGKRFPRGGTSSGKSTEVSVLRVGEKQEAAGMAKCTEGAGCAPGAQAVEEITSGLKRIVHHGEKAYRLPRNMFRVFLGELAEMLAGV